MCVCVRAFKVNAADGSAGWSPEIDVELKTFKNVKRKTILKFYQNMRFRSSLLYGMCERYKAAEAAAATSATSATEAAAVALSEFQGG